MDALGSLCARMDCSIWDHFPFHALVIAAGIGSVDLMDLGQSPNRIPWIIRGVMKVNP